MIWQVNIRLPFVALQEFEISLYSIVALLVNHPSLFSRSGEWIREISEVTSLALNTTNSEDNCI